MLTVEKIENNISDKIFVTESLLSDSFLKEHTHIQNGVPNGYVTAEEWLTQSKKNISEIFEKYEKGILQQTI